MKDWFEWGKSRFSEVGATAPVGHGNILKVFFFCFFLGGGGRKMMGDIQKDFFSQEYPGKDEWNVSHFGQER